NLKQQEHEQLDTVTNNKTIKFSSENNNNNNNNNNSTLEQQQQQQQQQLMPTTKPGPTLQLDDFNFLKHKLLRDPNT
ncbi:MAG: hypothetical protein N6V41_01260, partial [Candidatus Portiera aleyrodidarum]|nr:hypothetical protein [Candidatus Portiera aleyrodidarum]